MGKKSQTIVLTGGPGAGKTAALDLCRQEFPDKIVIVPESATLLYRGGFPRYTSKKGIECAQEAIYRVQLDLEKVQLLQHPHHTLLCDRGTVDGAVYWPKGPNHFFMSLKTSLKKEFSRYSHVLYLESAASYGDCIRSGNEQRTESPEEAINLDKKLRKIWGKHPGFYFIPRQETLLGKMELVRKKLSELL